MFNKEKLKKLDTTPQEMAALLCIFYDVNMEEELSNLLKKGYISSYGVKPDSNMPYVVYNKGRKLITDVAMSFNSKLKPFTDYTELATRLKALFPKGKKEGTNNYWAEGIAVLVRRLQLFNHKYPNKYTDDEIVNAAERYVKSFNGQYRTMRTLKYFLFKEEVNAAGENEGVSDLLNVLEAGESDSNSIGFDWDTNVV